MSNLVAHEPAPMATAASQDTIVPATAYDGGISVQQAVLSTQEKFRKFIIDSGSPFHFSGNIQNFKELAFVLEKTLLKGVGKGAPTWEAEGYGPVEFQGFTVEKVYYTPAVEENILSVQMLGEEMDYSVEFIRGRYIIREASRAAEIVKVIPADDGSAAAGEIVQATCAAVDDGSGAAAGKVLCQGTLDTDGYYTIDAKVVSSTKNKDAKVDKGCISDE